MAENNEKEKEHYNFMNDDIDDDIDFDIYIQNHPVFSFCANNMTVLMHHQ